MTILDTGWVNPGTTANQGSGSYTWSNTDNVKVSDDNDATISGHGIGYTSDELLVTNFGFSIPDDATIIGVEVRAESRTDTNKPGGTGIRFFNYYESVGGFFLFYNGSNIGDKYSNGIYFTTVETQLSAGGSTSMWGYAITPAIVNHSTFGFSGKVTWNMVGSGTAELDNMQIKIYYELPVNKTFTFDTILANRYTKSFTWDVITQNRTFDSFNKGFTQLMLNQTTTASLTRDTDTNDTEGVITSVSESSSDIRVKFQPITEQDRKLVGRGVSVEGLMTVYAFKNYGTSELSVNVGDKITRDNFDSSVWIVEQIIGRETIKGVEVFRKCLVRRFTA